ncbi:MAG: RDD family protein [Propionibacteriaceae bacterium]|nr:RDD family protein [Propionibacteriaceae bacterium]
MSETSLPAAGWYPDPADQARQRYWDGTHWTAETRGGVPDFAVEPATSYANAENELHGGDYGTQPVTPSTYQAEPSSAYQPGDIMPGYGAYNPDPAYEPPRYGGYDYSGPVTADGVPLAGWWWRVLAMVLDGALLTALGQVYSVFLPDWGTGFQRWVNDFIDAVERGALVYPDFRDPSYDFVGPLSTYAMVATVVALLYSTAMLSFKGATVGMLICRLRVVPVDQGLHVGGLPIGKAFLRCLAYDLMAAFAVPLVINVLFPLWDRGRQTLHDKIVGTQVVRLA